MTATPRFELDPAPDDGLDTPPGPVATAFVLAGGFLIGGPFGVAVAALAVLVWRRHPGWMGALVAGLLALAAVASVVGAWPASDSLRQSFADDRPWAAAAGLGAGVSLLVAVVRAARADRARRPTEHTATPAPPPRRLGPWLPIGAIALAAAVISLAAAPEALTAGARTAAEALRAGEGFVRVPGGPPAPYYPAAALVVAALFPSATALVVASLAAATAVATALLGTRLVGRREGLAAGALAAALPLVWDQRLPGALATLAVSTALLLAWPDRLTPARAVTAGALLVTATLARPEAALVIPVVVAWTLIWPGPRDRRAVAAHGAALVATVAVGLGLWAVRVHADAGSWWPETATWPLAVSGPRGIAVVALDLIALGLAIDELRWRWPTVRAAWARHLPWLAIPMLAGAVAVGTGGDRDLWFAVGPLVAVAAAASLSRHVGGRERTPDRVQAPV